MGGEVPREEEKVKEITKPAEKLVITSVFLHEGIVPIEGEHVSVDMNRALKGIDPDEARKMRRKFRKLWRKAVRAGSPSPARLQQLSATTGYGSKSAPGKQEKRARKQLVYKTVFNEKIKPLFKEVNDIKRKPSPDAEDFGEDDD